METTPVDDLGKLSNELMEEMMARLGPTSLFSLRRTSKHNMALVDDHRTRNFHFFHAVQDILGEEEERERVSLQDVLDTTGGFIWGCAVYAFICRKAFMFRKRKDGKDVVQCGDVDIFVHYRHVGNYLGWMHREINRDFPFVYDAGYDEDCPTIESAERWIDQNAPESTAFMKPPLVKVLRFDRPCMSSGLRLVVARRTPFELLLRAPHSESSFWDVQNDP